VSSPASPSTPPHPAPEATADPADLLALAVDTAREAAALVARGRASAREHVDTKSSPVDVVTAVDRDTERLVVARLLAARPDDGVLGEEGAARAGTSAVRWVVDPIDGTVNFLYGLPWFAVSVAAQVGGVSVAGAVVEPASGRVWSAARGQGAFLDGGATAPFVEFEHASCRIRFQPLKVFACAIKVQFGHSPIGC